MRRITEAAKKAAERRERENEARRLREMVPELERLTIAVEELRPGECDTEVRHVRRIVVRNAPAMFELPCCDRNCNGGHDLTRRILHGLQAHKSCIEGHDRCGGLSKDGECQLEMHFVAQAHYAH
jgi:hypothetical protein